MLQIRRKYNRMRIRTVIYLCSIVASLWILSRLFTSNPSPSPILSPVYVDNDRHIEEKRDIDSSSCDISMDSYKKCYKYTTDLLPYESVSIGIETILFLKKQLNITNETLVNASLYWNQDDRFKPFKNFIGSTNKCEVLYCGANDAGTDGLEFISQYANCQVWFLEPVAQFYDKLIHSQAILEKLQTGKHHFYQIGVSNKNDLIDITLQDIKEAQAVTLIGKQQNKENPMNEMKYKLILRDAAEILFEFHMLSKTINQTVIGELNLIHLNCEGCEYDVIERLIKTNLIQYIRIVQFGSHRPSAIRSSVSQRYCCLQQMLSATHQLEFGIPWAWERWLRKDLF
ncbi:unnamed protein product [Rotaria magnacalcarata]|uniref:Methyltransferase FkbM domain-containing protein n=3 Tax=Rotaria magnacalcarata TaxID=392030 RepID=A0A816QEZ6_9BILA|nr:unnamed protein product [Rotaria magnacalcarata]CAF2103410.1 unnamed protein product [Rotaria magnacalcarata]